MPEQMHTRFDDAPARPEKKVRLSPRGDEDSHNQPRASATQGSENANLWGKGAQMSSSNANLRESTAQQVSYNSIARKPSAQGPSSYSSLRRKPSRKAPSQVARSNRRAQEFKKNRLENGETPAQPATSQTAQGTQTSKPSGSLQDTNHPSSARRREQQLKPQPPPKPDSSADGSHNAGSLKAKAVSLQRVRQALPIWPYAEQIRTALRERNILLLVGETGSGKSTQVPQFLMSEAWCGAASVDVAAGEVGLNDDAENDAPRKDAPRRDDTHAQAQNVYESRRLRVGGCIAVTEPRRVAATTLARRVADELGSPLGKASPASLVGYSVRFDENTSPSNKVKFVTEGMLLQEMLRDPWLTRYSAVIVDEVHERGVNVDLLLGFLRRLVTKMAAGGPNGRGVPLKVVVMSATAEGSELVRFFQAGFDHVPPSEEMEETASNRGSEWSGLSDAEAPEEKDGSIPQSTQDVATLYFRGRQYPVKILHTPNPVADVIEASLVRIFTLNYQEALPGDILVFLTGQRTVEALCALIEEYSATLSKSVPRLMALPLFAALPQESQRRVFEPTPPPAKGHRGVRKVIVSTNIAETSVTVPGVRYVIDGGKEKVKQFRPRIGLDSLLTKPISNSSAIQRAGRAGREASGRCYRLYTEPDFDRLAPRGLPEILRCDLAQAVLALMARGVLASSIGTFPLLTMPPRESIKAALIQLHQLGAISDDGGVSEAGRLMAGLPVSASMAKALLKAAEPNMDCLDDMIDLVSAMSGEGIFLPGNEEEEADMDLERKSRRDDLWRRDGDHATMIMAVRGFAAEHGDRRKWADTRGLSWRAMRGIMDIRKQLLALRERLTSSSGEKPVRASADTSTAVSSNTLRCLLAGFPLNAAILAPDGSYRTVSGRQTVAIHPSSVLFRRTAGETRSQLPKPAAIVYTEFVYTTRAYARGVSAVEIDWILEALGADWSPDEGI